MNSSKNFFFSFYVYVMLHVMYINILQMYITFSKMIATQGPKQNTVVEFWR